MKRCGTCQRVQASDCFYSSSTTADGLTTICKSCMKLKRPLR